nr:hypothetical protein [Agromyces badenianii]
MQQRDVRAADRLGVALCDPMERAVREQHSVGAVVDGFVPESLEHLGHRVGGRSQRPAEVGGDAFESGTDGVAGAVGFFDGAAEDLGGDIVVTLRHRGRDLTLGHAVELGRATRPGSRLSVAPLELGGQEPGVDESIEVEGGRAAWDAEGCGGLVPADRLVLPGDELEQRAPLRVGDRGDRRQGVMPCEAVHAGHPISKTRNGDKRRNLKRVILT